MRKTTPKARPVQKVLPTIPSPTPRKTETKKRAPLMTVSHNHSLDWTPAKLKVEPRRLSLKHGPLEIELEEIRWEDGSFGFLVLAAKGKLGPNNIVNGSEMLSAELDQFLEGLTLARDEAKRLGMPSAKR